MPRRPRARVATVTLPPKGHFTSHLAPLLAVQEHRVSRPAAHLWTVLRAHSWRDGRCDLSDQDLAAWLGGLSTRTIYNLRAELVAAGLLASVRAEDGVRWLAPLPFEERKRRNRGTVFPEIQFIGNERPKEEEVNINTIPPPPPLTPPPPEVFTGNELPPDAAEVYGLDVCFEEG